MAVGGKAKEPMSPVYLFSHGSTMMLGEESASADYWKKCGDEALANGIEHVVMMVRPPIQAHPPPPPFSRSNPPSFQGAHWATSLPGVLISANPEPQKSPVAYVHPSKYRSYGLKADLAMVPRVQALLARAGISARADPTFDWIHDTYLILLRMFPAGCPPTTIVSAQQRYDPHLHVAVGAALRPLRARPARTLLIGSGGAVHNLYRNVWGPMIRHRDNFAQPAPPAGWALDFRQAVVDTFCPGGARAGGPPAEAARCGYGRAVRAAHGAGGPRLRRRAVSLMKHPQFRDAHATDDHFMPVLFVAGLCGDWDDAEARAEMGAEDWELTNMCNSQYMLGTWEGYAEA